MDGVELEGRPRQPLMLKEWLELEPSAELSRDGFGCYPRHLAAELRSASARRRGNGDVIARFSAAVRAALSLPLPGREGEAAMLSRSLSRRLRAAGFWRKRKGDAEETDRPVASCSAASSSRRRDAPSSSSPATSPRRASWEGRQGGGDGAGLIGGRRSHETVVEGCNKCETTCHLDEEREQEQRLSPVSVMDFPSQDGEDDGNDDDDCKDHGVGDGRSEDDDGASPTFEQSLATIRRASQQLLQRIRRFEQLAEIDVDDATTTTTAEDSASCHVEEELDNSTEDGSLPAEAGSPCAAAPHCLKKLLQDFFREGLSSCEDGGSSDDPELEGSLLETAKAWLDGRHRALLIPDRKAAEVEEIERLGRWRWSREDEREPLGYDVEGGIFWSLVEELVDDLTEQCCDNMNCTWI